MNDALYDMRCASLHACTIVRLHDCSAYVICLRPCIDVSAHILCVRAARHAHMCTHVRAWMRVCMHTRMHAQSYTYITAVHMEHVFDRVLRCSRTFWCVLQGMLMCTCVCACMRACIQVPHLVQVFLAAVPVHGAALGP